MIAKLKTTLGGIPPESYFFGVFLFAVAGGLIGWIMNIVKLAMLATSPVFAEHIPEIIIRLLGIVPIVPLGAIAGWL